MHFVYALINPHTGETGYIGITNNPNQRYLEHIEGRVGKGKKYEWVKRLQEEQIQPKMKILEVVDTKKEAREREKDWIQHYLSLGMSLTNIMHGRPKTPQREPKVRRWKVKAQEPKVRKQRVRDQAPEEVPDEYYTAAEAREMIGHYGSGLREHVRSLRIRYIPSGKGNVYYYLKSDIDRAADELHDFYTKYPGFNSRKRIVKGNE